MVDYKVEDCKGKLSLIEGVDNQLRIVYGWVKQEHINLK